VMTDMGSRGEMDVLAALFEADRDASHVANAWVKADGLLQHLGG
jgi:hypothetical protein